MLQRDLQHLLGKIYTDHVVALRSQQPCKLSGPAAKIQEQAV